MLPDNIYKYKGEVLVNNIDDNGKEITEVEPSKYCYQVGIKKVIISEGIKKIGMEAFMYCPNMESLILPSSLEEISYAAFKCCSKIERITFKGTSLQWFNVKIGEFNDVFKKINVKCEGDIWEYEILSEKELTSIKLTSYKGEFSEGTLKIPDKYDGFNVKEIGEGCLLKKAKIKYIQIPDSIHSIGDSAFEDCINLREVILPKNINKIGNKAFKGCTSLEKVYKESVEGNILRVGDEAFSGCVKLQDINLSDDLTYMGNFMMMNCKSITEINIPKNVSYIGEGTFVGCDSVESVQVDESNNSYKISNRALIQITGERDNILIYCPITIKGQYAVSDYIKEIGSHAFRGCKNITSIVLPVYVRKISQYAFYGCEKIKSVDLTYITDMGDRAFEGCKTITEINLPKMNSMGSYLFAECVSVKSIIVGNGVTELTTGVFRNCSDLTYIALPESLKNIQNKALYNDNPISVRVKFGGTRSQWDILKKSIDSSVSVTLVQS